MNEHNVTDGYLRIGKVAKTIGLHPQTLRRWEREGRTGPAKRNVLTGQRQYDDADVERLLAMIEDRKQ